MSEALKGVHPEPLCNNIYVFTEMYISTKLFWNTSHSPSFKFSTAAYCHKPKGEIEAEECRARNGIARNVIY